MAERYVKFGQFVDGGLINDRDVTFTEVSFSTFDYDGNGPEVCALRIVMTDGDGEEHTNYWSVGGKEGDFGPSKDGKRIVQLRDKTSLNKRSNAHIFMEKLISCGMPADQLEDDVSLLVGTKAHVIRVPAPSRDGLPGQKKREDGRQPEVLVVSEVHSFPWDKKGGKKSTGSTAAKNTSKAVSADSDDAEGGDIETRTGALVLAALKEAVDNALELTDLSMAVFQAATSAGWEKSDRKQAMTLAGDASYLGNLDNVRVSGDVVSLGS
jgi:hypothetical protein